MSIIGGTEGHISRQSASYRQGLVLGLTMAEIMILLVFCLLIALAAFLKAQYEQREALEQKLRETEIAANADRKYVQSLTNNPRLKELLERQPGAGDQAKIDQYWRELTDAHSVMSEAQQNGLSSEDVRSGLKDLKTFKDKKIDFAKIERDALITGSVDRVIKPAGSATPDKVASLLAKGLIEPAPAIPPAPPPPPSKAAEGHKWPPIIAIDDTKGRFFRKGSAEVDTEFRKTLLEGPESTAIHISNLIREYKEYEIDVIEVVGHTDEQRVGNRQSNLDSDLVSVLSSKTDISAIKPSDNAGLGLARAVSVVGILRQSKELAGYKILPFSGGQLINTNETLALGENPGDIPERRRIEIRLRKSTPRLIEQRSSQSAIQKITLSPAPSTPLPPTKPVAQPSAPALPSPLQLMLPPGLFLQGQSQ